MTLNLNNSYSKQENFVLDVLGFKKNGHYVELGAYHSSANSNTYYLEKDFAWAGISFEIVDARRSEFNDNRLNPCYGDALQANYYEVFEKHNFPKQIDFLQIDIDDGGHTHNTRYAGLHALMAIPLNSYRFSVITFEHDTNMYFRNATIRDTQREILDSFGYSLIVRDIHEDWWIDSRVFSVDQCRKYCSKEYQLQLMAHYQ